MYVALASVRIKSNYYNLLPMNQILTSTSSSTRTSTNWKTDRLLTFLRTLTSVFIHLTVRIRADPYLGASPTNRPIKLIPHSFYALVQQHGLWRSEHFTTPVLPPGDESKLVPHLPLGNSVHDFPVAMSFTFRVCPDENLLCTAVDIAPPLGSPLSKK